MCSKLTSEIMDLILILSKNAKNVCSMHCNKNGKKNKDELTIVQFHILLCIHKFDNKATLSDLVTNMGLSKSNLSILVSKLEADGYVCRDYNGDTLDKRKINMSLTNKGLEILFNKQNDIHECIDQEVNQIGKDDYEFLQNAIPRMIKIVKDANARKK